MAKGEFDFHYYPDTAKPILETIVAVTGEEDKMVYRTQYDGLNSGLFQVWREITAHEQGHKITFSTSEFNCGFIRQEAIDEGRVIHSSFGILPRIASNRESAVALHLEEMDQRRRNTGEFPTTEGTHPISGILPLALIHVEGDQTNVVVVWGRELLLGIFPDGVKHGEKKFVHGHHGKTADGICQRSEHAGKTFLQYKSTQQAPDGAYPFNFITHIDLVSPEPEIILRSIRDVGRENMTEEAFRNIIDVTFLAYAKPGVRMHE